MARSRLGGKIRAASPDCVKGSAVGCPASNPYVLGGGGTITNPSGASVISSYQSRHPMNQYRQGYLAPAVVGFTDAEPNGTTSGPVVTAKAISTK